MEQHYFLTKLLLITLFFLSVESKAQSPTVVSSSTDCGFVRNFTNSDEGFSSPSIYSDDNDVSFFWISSSGDLVENSGLIIRAGSLISPVYPSTTPGITSVGFTYSAPVGTEYRIRVIAGAGNAPLNILATTANGPQWTALPSTSGSLCLQLSDADIQSGQAIRYEFSFRAAVAGDITFDDFGVSAANAPLPVTFLGFVAKKNSDATVKLLWDVADEINVKGYYVEKSSNGIDYTSIGFVPASGKSVYTLTDNLSDTKVRFYRVKNVDIDERSKYSPIIKVSGLKPSNTIQLYPVPAKVFINIQHEAAPSKAVITLTGLDGKILIRKEVIPNTQQTNLYIAGLNPGLYVIRYEDEIGSVQTIKFVKE